MYKQSTSVGLIMMFKNSMITNQLISYTQQTVLKLLQKNVTSKAISNVKQLYYPT